MGKSALSELFDTYYFDMRFNNSNSWKLKRFQPAHLKT